MTGDELKATGSVLPFDKLRAAPSNVEGRLQPDLSSFGGLFDEPRWLLKLSPVPDWVVDIGLGPDDDEWFSRIRCPLCRWQPRALDTWSCMPIESPELPFEGCGTVWNTFSTRGRCPGCGHQWRWTSCLRCAQWSLHEDWYEPEESPE